MSKIDREALYSLWLLLNAGQCTPKTYKALRLFGSFETIFEASPSDFPREFFSPAERNAFADKKLDSAVELLMYCKDRQISMIHYNHPEYPQMLRQIHRPPLVLFVRGKLPDFSRPSVAVIGSRSCSETGRKFAARLAYEISLRGGIVVSGVADGIDQYAQKGAIYARSPNVAVLPCGVDLLYSESCRDLYAYTLNGGVLVSEYLPRTPARKTHFDARNRIISGLSRAVVVVEAGQKSGAFLTVNHAIEQNKPVFAVPGFPGSPYSEGTNLLIEEGAMVCTGAQSVLDSLDSDLRQLLIPLKTAKQQRKQQKSVRSEAPAAEEKPLSDSERELCAFLGESPISVDELCEKTAKPFGEILSRLRSLELADVVESVYGGYYKIKKKS